MTKCILKARYHNIIRYVSTWADLFQKYNSFVFHFSVFIDLTSINNIKCIGTKTENIQNLNHIYVATFQSSVFVLKPSQLVEFLRTWNMQPVDTFRSSVFILKPKSISWFSQDPQCNIMSCHSFSVNCLSHLNNDL